MLRCTVAAFAKATARKKGAATATITAATAVETAKGLSTDARVRFPSEPPAAKELAAAGKARRAAGKLRFDAYKAGLQKVDKAHVERVIQEASKGSAFYQKEQRKEEARREKTEAILKKAEEYKTLSPQQKHAIRERVDSLERQLEATRDVRRRFIHVDFDMFYAAVEEKKNPQLRDVPFGVGSQPMLATTNYIARQYGVRSGMPGFIGKKLCPDLLIVPTDFAAYRREAATAHAIAARYDPDFVSLGLDELTMDVTNYLKEFPYLTASQIATDFRDEVFAKTQLSCSGGIAPTPTLAKIASNVNKPNGQHEITLLDRNDFLKYVRDIPLRKIPGIGYAQESTLNALGIRTCGDLLKNKYLLAYLFKEKTFEHYLAVGLGLMGTNAHRQHEMRQSIGKEVSFSEPLSSPDALAKLFRKLIEPCHARCVREGLHPKQIRLVLKYRTYDTQQFSISLPRHTSDLKLWLEAARKLLEPHLQEYAELRLVGVRVQKFATEGSAELRAESDAAAAKGPGGTPDTITDEPVEILAPAGGAPRRERGPLGAQKKVTEVESDDARFDADDEDEHHRAMDDKIAATIEESGEAAAGPQKTPRPSASSAYANYAARYNGGAGGGAGKGAGKTVKTAASSVKKAAKKKR